jgi:Kef-type K+ transport system membrane component KefB
MNVSHLLAASTVDSYTLTGDRIVATAAALIALAGVIVGALARRRGRTGTGTGRRESIVAVAAGFVGMVAGAWVVATADGGPGTGNGIVGAWIAMALGVAALALGGLALTRTRRQT